jgi:hypothetical protein
LIKQRFGTETAILSYSEEREPFLDANQQIVTRYQQSIKDARTQLTHTKRAIQQIKALTGF